MMSEDTKVWLITGASSGLGRALAEAVLARDGRVLVRGRSAGKWRFTANRPR